MSKATCRVICDRGFFTRGGSPHVPRVSTAWSENAILLSKSAKTQLRTSRLALMAGILPAVFALRNSEVASARQGVATTECGVASARCGVASAGAESPLACLRTQKRRLQGWRCRCRSWKCKAGCVQVQRLRLEVLRGLTALLSRVSQCRKRYCRSDGRRGIRCAIADFGHTVRPNT